jgi:hypothetical protein
METKEPDTRDCYCGLWETDPQSLIDRGIPRGYCGFCEAEIKGKACGKPGHVRQLDGPYSACLCDEHYAGGEGFNPVKLGCSLFYLLLLAVVVWLIIKWVF